MAAPVINISIIIPHYNIPHLLLRCIASIPKRDDVQIIVVDDGSPDFDTYRERFPQLYGDGIEIIPNRHQGRAGMMRNIGLSYAKGRYVIFLDSDDFLSEKADAIFDKIISHDEDVLFFHSTAVLSDDLNIPSNRWQYYETILNGRDEFSLRYLYSPATGKVINRQFIENYGLRFSRHHNSDDVIFSVLVGIRARSISVEDDFLFVITDRQESLSYGLRNGCQSFENMRICFEVELAKCRILKHHNVNNADVVNMLFYNVRQFKAKHKIHYLLFAFRSFFVYPSVTMRCIKLDVQYIVKKIMGGAK